MHVSIHAPAWGATADYAVLETAKNIVSIHAPAWGATYNLYYCTTAAYSFNPRARVGRDKRVMIALL